MFGLAEHNRPVDEKKIRDKERYQRYLTGRHTETSPQEKTSEVERMSGMRIRAYGSKTLVHSQMPRSPRPEEHADERCSSPGNQTPGPRRGKDKTDRAEQEA